MRGRDTMTKLLKVTLLSLTFLLVAMIVVTGIFLEASLQKNRAELSQIYTRREDLLNQQQQLSVLMSQMNSTLMSAIEKNSNMTAELAKVTQEKAALQLAAQQQASQQQTSQAAITPALSPAPQPVTVNRVVTRAS